MFLSQEVLDSKCAFGFTVSLTPAATAADSSVEQAFTLPSNVPALRATDLVVVGGPGSGNALNLGAARVNSTGQLVLNFVNPTAGSLTHAAGAFTVFVIRL